MQLATLRTLQESPTIESETDVFVVVQLDRVVGPRRVSKALLEGGNRNELLP